MFAAPDSPLTWLEFGLIVSLAMGLGAAFIGWVVGRERRIGEQRKQAQARAWQLLDELLDPLERVQLRASHSLEVQSRLVPGRIYRVPQGRGMVQIFIEGQWQGCLCIQPVHWLPEADALLAHKLMLEGAEGRYLQTARFWSGESATAGAMWLTASSLVPTWAAADSAPRRCSELRAGDPNDMKE